MRLPFKLSRAAVVLLIELSFLAIWQRFLGLFMPLPPWLWLVVAAYLFWSLRQLTKLSLAEHSVTSRFGWRTGLLVLPTLGLSLLKVDDPTAPAFLQLLLPLYFGGSLAAFGLARADQIARHVADAHEELGFQNKVSLGLSGLLIVGSLVLTLLFDRQAAVGVLGLLGQGLLLLARAVWTLIFPLAYPVQWVYNFLFPRADHSGGRGGETVSFGLRIQAMMARIAEMAEDGNPGFWLAYLPLGLLLLAIAIWLFLSWQRRRSHLPSRRLEPDARESLFTWARLLSDLRWLRPRPPQIAQEADPSGARAVYRSFLTWGRSQGYPRPPHQTAQGYQGRFEQPEVALITEVYQAARYGPQLPAADAVARAQTALRQLTG